ncbi:MAG: RNase adapter RapZ [gamma proteobacterium symbiont of Bathyaustriella thionipta]|nr:RNase adapter RapZ [gamma proteobacterium symbiont of Bathyaustriella thionipta]MCU7948440.1 RNase adapter RapZ [gamma proteobacterium symbiont of Bathyaustriella thionipta]MCU7954139.1 RNase adapter RapZ [gamma proteobacterium symbiont of Bathyaustriella thionipta]MCU7955990.1 RNase adapter RapZ [gamma proteobacterium symbiont of Bathyaustriella thionipta]MCU7968161.1 RNase adapter RapZ [gamma proteobacterium symbiont of Bathyaustriella thionipta]
MKLQIVSGLSGSGKTIALQVLEDLDYYCIANLPLELLSELVEKSLKDRRYIDKIAVGIDARTLGSNFSSFAEILQTVEKIDIECHVLFLHAQTNILLKRFSETRRKHPLTNEQTSLEEAINRERLVLKMIQDEADQQINTSSTNVHQLRDRIKDIITLNNQPVMALQFLSFGFKHGLPDDMDMMFDMRCLPNPHWEPALRPFTGKDQPVADFLDQQESCDEMFEDIQQYVDKWLPCFEENNRNYLTIAIGCTGGQHRSVYMVEKLAHYFMQHRESVIARHKELEQR